MSAPSHLTDCGLPGIKEIPYGVHMCHFYANRAELAGALVPYLAAGLRNNERCLCVTSVPLDDASLKAALQAAGIDVAAEERKGSLAIRSHSEWFANGTLGASQIIELWLAEEKRALSQGFDGLRIAGNPSFVTPEAWPDFMHYEQIVGPALHGHRIVTLCSYPHSACGPSEVLDVVRSHDCTLDHPDGGWQVLNAPSRLDALA